MPLDVVGETEVTFSWALSGLSIKCWCAERAQQVLSGINFLSAYKCIINFDTNTVYNKEGLNKMDHGCLDRVYRITVAETVPLSPHMVADIPCGCTGTSEQVFRKVFCSGLRKAVTVKEGRIPVRVFSYLNKPLTIYRCSSIGDLYPLAGEEESQEETNVGVSYKVVPPAASKEDAEGGLEAKQFSAVFVRALIDRAGGLFGRILTKVASTDRTQ